MSSGRPVLDTPAAIRRRRRRRVPDDERKRAAKACDRCKARKSKCIETKPGQCQRCIYNNLTCKFESENSPAEDDVKTIIESSPKPDDTAAATAVTPYRQPYDAVKNLDDDISIDSHQNERIMWPRFLSRLREAFSLDTHIPPAEEQDMVAMQAHIIRPTMTLQPPELRRVQQAIEAFPPRQVADFLVSVCINHGTDAFFYFDQGRFLAELDEFYTNPSSPLRSDNSFVCLALATFALGSQWTTLVRPDSSSTGMRLDEGDPGRMFHNHAKTLIPDITDRPCLRSIQAPFIMGVYLLPASAIGSSYVYMGLALRKALAFDLHLNTDDPSIDEREREVRRRLWWAIYSLERTTTVKLNRPRSVNADIITVPLPSPLPALDREQRFDNVQHQIANARLIKILDRVAELGTWSLDSSKKISPEDGEADLKGWKRLLPAGFKLDTIHPKDSSFRAVFHLYLNYYYSWIAMGKVALVNAVRMQLQYYFGRDSKAPEIDEVATTLSKSCVKAGTKMLHMFENLTRTGNITRFSFTDFQGCSIATIVVLLGGILERDSGYHARVTFGLDCLRRMAIGNMTAMMGVRFVEALQSIANEAYDKLHQTQTSTGVPKITDKVTNDYTNWADWLSRADQSESYGDSTASGQHRRAETVMSTPSQAESWTNPATGWGASGQQGRDQPHTQPHAQPHTQIYSNTHSQAQLPPVASISNMPIAAPALPQNSVMMQQAPATETDFMSAIYNEDQTFLMGLTGLDVLDFSGYITYAE